GCDPAPPFGLQSARSVSPASRVVPNRDNVPHVMPLLTLNKHRTGSIQRTSGTRLRGWPGSAAGNLTCTTTGRQADPGTAAGLFQDALYARLDERRSRLRSESDSPRARS